MDARTAARARTLALSAALVSSLAACGQGGGDDGPRGALDITVAPLELEGITDAEFAIRVYNDEGDLVWSEEHLWASRYGRGDSGLGIVGTCDASGTGRNRVQLVLRGLVGRDRGPIAEDTYVNPAPDVSHDDDDALVRDAQCTANGDTKVPFDLVLAREAEQGFVDVTVDFEDVSCSAKLDCVDAFLHDPSSGRRGPTAIMGFACASGDDQPVNLYLSGVRVSCTNGEGTTYDHTFPAAALEQGNQGGDGLDPSAIFEVAHTWGEERFDFDKCFWNHAFGLDLEALDGLGACTLEAWGTASHEEWLDLLTPAGAVYPVIHWKVPLTRGGEVVCEAHPLGSDEVEIHYVDGSELERQPFSATYACGDDPISGDQREKCGDGAIAELTIDGQLTVSVDLGGGVVVQDTLSLEPGTRLAGECCLHGCCQGGTVNE